MSDDLLARIDRLSRRRQELWASGDAKNEVAAISRQLAEAYEDVRQQRARRHGADRAAIVKTARVESELERLISASPRRS